MKYMLKQYSEKTFELLRQCERGKDLGKYYDEGRKYSRKGIQTRLESMQKLDEVDFNGIQLIIRNHGNSSKSVNAKEDLNDINDGTYCLDGIDSFGF